MIGAFGPMVFSVSQGMQKTFQGLSRENSGRWAKHDVLGRKPKTQRIGPDLDTVSFAMVFDVAFGMNPRKEMDQLVVMEREGKPYALTIGGKGLGTGLWTITSVKTAFTRVDGFGNVLAGTADISLQEYVVRKK